MHDLSPHACRPVQPESPKVLPAVAAAWPLLTHALADARTPLVEAALAVLAVVMREAGGAFMARRCGGWVGRSVQGGRGAPWKCGVASIA